MALILPTHTCFDDALDWISDQVLADPSIVTHSDPVLVHAIVRHPQTGAPSAHAWIEELGLVFQHGIIEGERVRWACGREEYYRLMRVEQPTVYTIAEALRENLKHGNYGPWREAYLALCVPRGTHG